MHKLLAVAMLAALSVSAHAQNVQPKDLPSQEMTEAKRKEAMDALNNMTINNKLTRLQLNSNGAAMNAAGALPGANAPVSKSTQADFLNLARPGSGNPQQPKAAGPAPLSSDLMIFVSMSMPEQMLQQYAAQAKRFNAVLMMRGFVGDKMSITKDVLQRLNASGAQWEISPEPFKTFKIDKVPAIVLATAESASITEEGCAKPETYTAVFGDLSVYDALDKMSLLGQKEVSAMAKQRLKADREAGKKGAP